MFEIKTMNNIAQQGLDELAAHKLTVNVDAENPDGVITGAQGGHQQQQNPTSY